jgi:hypothetical protein
MEGKKNRDISNPGSVSHAKITSISEDSRFEGLLGVLFDYPNFNPIEIRRRDKTETKVVKNCSEGQQRRHSQKHQTSLELQASGCQQYSISHEDDHSSA